MTLQRRPTVALLCTTMLVLLAGIPARAEDLPSLNSYGDRIVIQKDLPFAADAQPHQKLDLYLPRGEGPYPLVVCWFGGGFTGGDKRGMAKVCAFLADRGIAAAAPGYYLAAAGGDKPGWPRNVQDAKCAVRFLRANAAAHRLDPARVAGLGHSSGAYLAMMVAFTPDLKDLEGDGGCADQPSRLSAVVDIAGVCDRRAALGTGTLALLGKGYADNAALRTLASPVAHVTRQTVPVYILHGADDKTVLADSARQLDQALTAAAVDHDLQLLPKVGHNPITLETMTPLRAWLLAKLARPAPKSP